MREGCKNIRDLAIIELLYSTGIRVGELINLNIKDMNFTERLCIVLGKGNKQREWSKIEDTYKKGIEKFYKITLKNQTIGFFMLERLNSNYPFYLDYFAIFNEFQSKGYGTKAIRKLLDKIIINDGLIAEIEKDDIKNTATIRRLEFYKRLGFKKVESEYLLYNVVYVPIIHLNTNKYNKKMIDDIFFDYYKNNCGEEEIKNRCKIIK